MNIIIIIFKKISKMVKQMNNFNEMAKGKLDRAFIVTLAFIVTFL